MKILLDANILLDVFQNRQPHYYASVRCLDKILRSEMEGVIPAHVVTTFYYVMNKFLGKEVARDAIGWLLDNFTIAACDDGILSNAHASKMSDFEDAVVAMSAERDGCSFIVTRNLDDFDNSPVTAISPAHFLELL